MTLKLVKTNEREVTVNKPMSKYSSRTVPVKEKKHDLEIHHEKTGEPIFSVKPKSYGKGYDLEWHPYMQQLHPDLARSFEHGSRHHDRDRMSADSKSGVEMTAAGVYERAARSGFKDRLNHTVTQTPGSTNPNHHDVHFHDPDTGQKIVTAKRSPDGYGVKLSYHQSYLDAHGIDPSVATNVKPESGYEFASHIHANKGKTFNAVGDKKHKSSTLTYNSGRGKEDHEVSAAHEEQIRRKYGDKPGFKLERHSPTVFTASHDKPSEYGAAHHTTSVVANGKLIHHSFDPEERYGPEPHSDKF